MNKIETEYRADNIKVLEGLEAVRKRPAMYIGDTNKTGLHHLIYELVDNSIDEAMAGYCNQIDVTIHIDNSVTVQDNGRGIPVDIHPDKKITGVELVLTTLHAGGKFDHDSYQVSGGLHGVGLSVVNALSGMLELEIRRDGKVFTQKYERGEPVFSLREIGKTTTSGTKIIIKPDGTVFETLEFSFDLLSIRLRELSFLNKGLKINILDERNDKGHKFYYEGGIVSFIEFLNQNKNPLFKSPIYFEQTRAGVHIELSFQTTMRTRKTFLPSRTTLIRKKAGAI